MSISDQITRIQNARNRLREKLTTWGLVTGTAKLEDCVTALEGVEKHSAINTSVKEGESYTIPAGYHDGSGKVSGVAGGGNYELQEKSVTPTKTQQSVTNDAGYYGLSSVTVAPIPDNYQDVSDVNVVEAEVLEGKIFVKADGTETAGTMPNIGKATGAIDGMTTTSYTIQKGYHDGTGKVTLTSDIETALAAI